MEKVKWNNREDSYSNPEWAYDGIARPVSWSLYGGRDEVETKTTHNKTATLGQLKNKYDLKSFGLWSKDIPDINKLNVGDIIQLPHYVGQHYYADGDKVSGSVELIVKELRTITETKVVESSNGSKRTHKSSRKVVAVQYHSGTKFYDLFRSSKRRQYGSYYRTNDKVTIWLTQQKLFNLFLMDGGLCYLKRNKQDCMICDK
jgi:hypothetical protein